MCYVICFAQLRNSLVKSCFVENASVKMGIVSCTRSRLDQPGPWYRKMLREELAGVNSPTLNKFFCFNIFRFSCHVNPDVRCNNLSTFCLS